MSVDLFTFIGMYDRQLATAAHLLDRGAAHAGGEAEAMLDWRLIEDMAPLRYQLRVIANFTRTWPARVAGLEPPVEIDDTLDLAGFRTAIAESRAYLAALTSEQFDGREEEPLTIPLGNGTAPTLPAARWLTGFATTNVYFHLSIAYAIMRAKGVPIGKVDLFGGGL
ncbi:DUF1993 domain-containing protein [Sphingomonas sp.]|uniref:DUF1993 domain-containing protein n=1 Tax=Sphingomonas sp. TaxID=28214 RepID=UPI003B00AAAB